MSFFLLMLGQAHSQVLIGPVVGGQITSIRYDKDNFEGLYSAEPVFGFHVGASLSFRVQKRYFLQTSLMYAQRGKVIRGIQDPLLNNRVTYNYIDMPILYTMEFKSRVGMDKEYKWYLGAGPHISYWMGGRGVLASTDLNENLVNPPDYTLPYKITFRENPEVINENEMNVSDPNRFQFGLMLSAGLVFEPVREQRFMLSARYLFGHSYFSRTSDGIFGLPGIEYYEDDLQVRNQEFSLSLHYFIDTKIEERNKGKSTLKTDDSKKKTGNKSPKKSFKKINVNKKPAQRK